MEMSKDSQIHTGFILFLDILGFSNKVKTLSSEQEFRELINLLVDIKTLTETLSATGFHLADLKAASFSDSIILTIPGEVA